MSATITPTQGGTVAAAVPAAQAPASSGELN
nr:MAG TPA: hypothetical protein [Caudoviricetes sp.]